MARKGRAGCVRCAGCDSNTRARSRKHMLMHETKPHHCTMCGRCFRSEEQLDYHLRNYCVVHHDDDSDHDDDVDDDEEQEEWRVGGEHSRTLFEYVLTDDDKLKVINAGGDGNSIKIKTVDLQPLPSNTNSDSVIERIDTLNRPSPITFKVESMETFNRPSPMISKIEKMETFNRPSPIMSKIEKLETFNIPDGVETYIISNGGGGDDDDDTHMGNTHAATNNNDDDDEENIEEESSIITNEFQYITTTTSCINTSAATTSGGGSQENENATKVAPSVATAAALAPTTFSLTPTKAGGDGASRGSKVVTTAMTPEKPHVIIYMVPDTQPGVELTFDQL